MDKGDKDFNNDEVLVTFYEKKINQSLQSKIN